MKKLTLICVFILFSVNAFAYGEVHEIWPGGLKSPYFKWEYACPLYWEEDESEDVKKRCPNPSKEQIAEYKAAEKIGTYTFGTVASYVLIVFFL